MSEPGLPRKFASAIAREDVGVVVFRVAEEFRDNGMMRWSEPVQFRFERGTDGVYDLVMRTVPGAANSHSEPE